MHILNLAIVSFQFSYNHLLIISTIFNFSSFSISYLPNLSLISVKFFVISGSFSLCDSEFFAFSSINSAFSLSWSILLSNTVICVSKSFLSSSSIFTIAWFLCLPIAHLKQTPAAQSLQKPFVSSFGCSLQPLSPH